MYESSGLLAVFRHRNDPSIDPSIDPMSIQSVIPQIPEPVELKKTDLPIAKPYDKQLAKDCRDKLGYDGHRINSNHLAGVLVKLKIEPYDKESVQKYKEYMQIKVIREKAAGWTAEWKRVDLKNYQTPIPETQLQRALAIKDELPEANFYVEELIAEKQVLDPFLFVQFRKEEYCIGCWEEPTFIG